jgi:two-component system, OmpR family, KDP operon response regulator KdpE
MNKTILLVEDDQHIARFLFSALALEHYKVSIRCNLKSAQEFILSTMPDLILLDLTLPDGNGKDLLLWFRDFSDIPIVVISAQHDESEKVFCFDHGANDYLAKPFGISELLARIRGIFRRINSLSIRKSIFCVENLKVNFLTHEVWVENQATHLTPIEFKIIKLLIDASGSVLTHRELLKSVWGADFVDHTHYLRVHMGRLRSKIELNSIEPKFIITEPGVGYRFSMSENKE